MIRCRRTLYQRGLQGALAGVGCIALLALPTASPAATITVNTTNDVHGTLGNCSLREAISSANTDGAFGNCTAGSGNDTIVVPGGTYRLTIPRTTENATATDNTQGDLDVTDFATLRPRLPLDRVVIDGNGAVIDDRVLQSTAVGAGLTIIGVTAHRGVANNGAGIRNSNGVLRLERVTVTDNTSNSSGGVLNTGAVAELTMINSTVSGNSADNEGGGIRVFAGTATLRNTTVADNTADADNNGSGDGGGLLIAGSGTLSLQNSLVAANTDRGGEAPDCAITAGTLASAGNTLIGTLTGCGGYAVGPGDVIGAAPRLGPLAFNGGPNATRALRPGSPAINRGAGCAAADQRGLPRRFGGACDIGAYELARCAGAIVNRVGTPGANRLVGTSGRDGIMGLAGNDRLLGRGGNDSLCGQGGFDRLLGGAKADRLLGGAKADRLFGGPGFDRLFGQRGFDRLFGGAGLDRLFGGPGRDLLNGQRGRDRCHGGPGRDRARRCAVRRRIG